MGFPASKFQDAETTWYERGRTEVPTGTLLGLYDKVLFKEMTIEVSISYKRLGLGENRV